MINKDMKSAKKLERNRNYWLNHFLVPTLKTNCSRWSRSVVFTTTAHRKSKQHGLTDREKLCIRYNLLFLLVHYCVYILSEHEQIRNTGIVLHRSKTP